MSTLFIRVKGPAVPVAGAVPSAGSLLSVDEASDMLGTGSALESQAPVDELAVPIFELEAQWLISEANGDVRAEGNADLRGLSELVDPDADWIRNPVNVVLLVPAGLVLNINCDVPGRNASQIRRALPFAVEEFIATDIEMMHVAAGDIGRGGRVRSHLIELALLDNWLAALHSIGIRPGYALSEAEMLPGSAGYGTLLFDGDEVLMKNIDSAACVDAENLEFVLGPFIEAVGSAADAEGEADAVIETINGEVDPLSIAQLPPDLANLEFKAVTLEPNQSVFAYLASLWHSRGALADNGINLLQGEYSVRMNTTGQSSRWRSVAAIAAAWFVIALIGLGAKGFYSDREAERLRAESQALYKDIYPDTRRIPPNIKRDVQFRMGGTSASEADFVPLVGQLTEHLTKAVKVRSFNFQGTREELSTELILSGFDALDELKEKLAGGGLSVEISSADQQSDGVHARMRLRSGNAR